MSFERPHWKKCIAETLCQLQRAPRLLVASDFDGTLSPLVDHPEMAVLHPDAPQVIRDLEELYPRVRLAFLSGRSLADLEPRLGITGERIILAGNHGLELRGARMDWTHPSCVAARPHLVSLATRIHHECHNIAGVELEDKGASLTLHYRRMAAEHLPALRDILNILILPEQLQMHEGNKVFEFRPRVDWSKGFAIRRIMRRLGISDEAVVYLGDDLTDEDVFRELGAAAVTVHVGPASNAGSARLNADDPADAVEFLGMLASDMLIREEIR